MLVSLGQWPMRMPLFSPSPAVVVTVPPVWLMTHFMPLIVGSQFSPM